MQSLLDDLARARKIGQALRQRAIEMFSWERAGHEIESVYERVMPIK
jgi:glycosyltransferase involved in cell wall biosynthesis